MFGNILNLMLGIALTWSIMSENCSAGISGQLQSEKKVLKYSVTLEKQDPKLPAALEIFFDSDKSKNKQTISFKIENKQWMSNQDLQNDFLEQVVKRITSPNVLLELVETLEKLSNEMEIKQLDVSINTLSKAFKLVSDPIKSEELINLPEPNKMMLFDLADRFVKENRFTDGKREKFSAIRDILSQELKSTECLTFDVAANTINRGFQSGQNYKKYTQIDGVENLVHLVHCFFICKGYEIQKIDPSISLEDLQILIRRVVDSCDANTNGNLFNLVRKLENIICEQ